MHSPPISTGLDHLFFFFLYGLDCEWVKLLIARRVTYNPGCVWCTILWVAYLFMWSWRCCTWWNGAPDNCLCSFFLPFFFFFFLCALYGYCWILAMRRNWENSSTALKAGRVATLSCINSRGGAYLFHVYLPCFTPILYLIIFTALVMQIEK